MYSHFPIFFMLKTWTETNFFIISKFVIWIISCPLFLVGSFINNSDSYYILLRNELLG